MAQKQKCKLWLYENFLIANQNRCSTLELARVEPTGKMSHDSVTRFLMRKDFKPQDLWRYAKPMVAQASPDLSGGYLVADDTVIAKPYAHENEFAHWQYSGQTHSIVNGMNLVNLLWCRDDEHIPVDYRIYSPVHDGKDKNDHFLDMLDIAEKRGLKPLYTLMDSWYSSLRNLKAIRKKQWHWITNLKSNRLISLEKNKYISVTDLDLDEGTVKRVWLKGYGFVLVCRIVFKQGDARYLATDNMELTDHDEFIAHWEKRWQIEEYHRGLKQAASIGGCSARRAGAQRTHIFASVCAFLKLEVNRLATGETWYEQTAEISRFATRRFLANA